MIKVNKEDRAVTVVTIEMPETTANALLSLLQSESWPEDDEDSAALNDLWERLDNA